MEIRRWSVGMIRWALSPGEFKELTNRYQTGVATYVYLPT